MNSTDSERSERFTYQVGLRLTKSEREFLTGTVLEFDTSLAAIILGALRHASSDFQDPEALASMAQYSRTRRGRSPDSK